MEKNNELRGSIPYDKDKLAALAVELIETANKMGVSAMYAFMHDSSPTIVSGMVISPPVAALMFKSLLEEMPRPAAMAVLTFLQAVLNGKGTEEDTENND